MELPDFPFNLTDGAELIITAEVTEDDTIITGLSCPCGALNAQRLLDAYLSFDAIEERAREIYGERTAEIISDRKAAGVAGEGSEVA